MNTYSISKLLRIAQQQSLFNLKTDHVNLFKAFTAQRRSQFYDMICDQTSDKLPTELMFCYTYYHKLHSPHNLYRWLVCIGFKETCITIGLGLLAMLSFVANAG